MAQYIPAFVLQKYNTQFAPLGGSPVGAILQIQTPDNGAIIDGDVWAVPVNQGVYAGWTFLPYNPNNPTEATAPDLFSVAAVKISSRTSSDVYIVLGTAAQYVTAAAGGAALPQVWPTRIHTVQLLPACQTIRNLDTNGLYYGDLGIPSLPGGATYFPFGFLNGVALATASSSGYSTTTALLAFLNANWSSVGTWTKTSDDLTLVVTQAAGPGTDVFCGGIVTILTSL